MHNLLWFVCFLTLLFVNGACKKDEAQLGPEPIPVPMGDERLLKQSSLHFGVDSIAYNADKMPERLLIAGPGDLVTMTYSGNIVTYRNLKFGKAFAKRVYEFENEVVKKSTFYAVGKEGKETESAANTYFYKDGKLIKDVYSATDPSVQGFYIEYFYDSANENVSVKKVHDKAGNLLEKTTFEYSDILDKSGFINQWTSNMDGTLFPRKSKYLKIKQVVEGNNSVQTSTFTYTLDAQGYVIKGKRVDDNGIQKETEWTNTWQ
ncbi:MAG: hypothetical protein ABIN80_08015 [Dyadobacter sp.]|uniref:hypothetical protein n=1 Tax=Dyadobacter sp. TaxID=1914288 RepID=UPI0032677B97